MSDREPWFPCAVCHNNISIILAVVNCIYDVCKGNYALYPCAPIVMHMRHNKLFRQIFSSIVEQQNGMRQVSTSIFYFVDLYIPCGMAGGAEFWTMCSLRIVHRKGNQKVVRRPSPSIGIGLDLD